MSTRPERVESSDVNSVEQVLNKHFFKNYPADAVVLLEDMAVSDILPIVTDLPADILIPVWSRLVPRFAALLTQLLPEPLAIEIIELMLPNDALRIIAQMSDKQSEELLNKLAPPISAELQRLMSYPDDSAGRLMDTRVPVYRASMRVEETLDSLRKEQMKTARSLFLVDMQGRISGRVLLQDLALAVAGTTLNELAKPVKATVQAIASQEDVAEVFSKNALLDLPVVDINGVLLGVIVHSSMLQAVQDDSSADIQTMVGVSREERALSSPFFAVKKRMPWLQVNLLTAFLAAAVVGLFEHTIAQVTALAILLPVVAGQSGNAGAQALAVTMRGLALREISIRHWFSVMFKEVRVGFLNGLSIAATCGLGVFIWSGSVGLVVVIMLSMVIAMVAAGFAGAVVPILLVRLGQDPAQSSSIILTTITDIAGFFSFLGIATVLMDTL